MEVLRGYALTIGWLAPFFVLAYAAHFLFDRLTPFRLRRASDGKNRAVGHVLRGLYLGLAVILLGAIRGNHNLGWALVDGGFGVFLLLFTYVAFDRLDPRDFGKELAADNTMLGMEIEGLLVLTAAIVVGAMNLVVF